LPSSSNLPVKRWGKGFALAPEPPPAVADAHLVHAASPRRGPSSHAQRSEGARRQGHELVTCSVPTAPGMPPTVIQKSRATSARPSQGEHDPITTPAINRLAACHAHEHRTGLKSIA
jgi:hypothetical protein